MPVTLAQWTAHKRRQRNPLWPSSAIFWSDLAIFAVVCAGTFSVNLVGSLPGNEILILLLLPFLLLHHGKRAFRREYLWFYIFLACWLFGTIVGDLYLGTPVANKLKGIARVVFLGFDFMAFAILINKKTREFVVFLLADAVALFVASRQFAGGTDFLTEWKFGLSATITILALMAASYFYGKRRYWIAVFTCLGLGAVNLIFAYRSSLAMDLMAAVLVLPTFAKPRTRPGSQGAGNADLLRVFIALALTAVAAFGANQLVKYAANRNWFNDAVEAKFEVQSGGRLGVLVGGRPETLVAIRAIIDSPIIGHGSFAQDMKYVQMMQDIQYEYGYSGSDEPDESLGLAIPTHSHLTQAWVESGILGGVFWVWVLILVWRTLLQIIIRRPALMPLYAYISVSFTWDVLYSPMGSTDRMVAIFMILLCLDLLHEWSGKPLLPRRGAIRSLHPRTMAGWSRVKFHAPLRRNVASTGWSATR